MNPATTWTPAHQARLFDCLRAGDLSGADLRWAILAGTSERGCCQGCGAPWRQMIEALPCAGGTGAKAAGNGACQVLMHFLPNCPENREFEDGLSRPEAEAAADAMCRLQVKHEGLN